jgi:hypothetical protein
MVARRYFSDEPDLSPFLKALNDVRQKDAIPQPLIASAEQLRAAQPELFEKQPTQRIGAVGSDFSPANATEFLDEVLTNDRLRLGV